MNGIVYSEEGTEFGSMFGKEKGLSKIVTHFEGTFLEYHCFKCSVSVSMSGNVKVVGVGVQVGERFCQNQVDGVDMCRRRGVKIVGDAIVNFKECDPIELSLVRETD